MSTGSSPRTLNGTHRPCVSVAVLEHELSELRLLLERYAGVLLNCPTELLIARVSDYLDRHHLSSAGELLDRLRASDPQCEALLDTLLDGKTGFFAHPAAFEAFSQRILPTMEQQHPIDSPCTFRIWSTGCSTGEEAYSIAMAVCQQVNCGTTTRKIHILATDIRGSALEIAERGLYPREALAGVPRPLVQAYFSRMGQHIIVKPRLRNLVTFAPMNLTRPSYLGQFDCIFCMNVLPHFSVVQRIALLERLHLYLQPGGFLLLGDGEKIPASSNLNFEVETHGAAVLYRKPLAATASSGK